MLARAGWQSKWNLTKSEYHAFLWLAASSALVRLLWIVSVRNPVLVGDATWYDARARELAAGVGYQVAGAPTAFFPVGYPLFLALLYRVAGHSFLAAKLANVALGVLTCLLVFVIARRVYNNRAAILALLIMAFYPGQVFYTSLLFSETLFTALLMGYLSFVFSHEWNAENPRARLCAGMMLGVACLVRATALCMPIVAFIDKVWCHKLGLRRSVKHVAQLSLAVLIILLPWVIRNIIVMGHPVLVSTNGGVNFWMGQTVGTYAPPPAELCVQWTRPGYSPWMEVVAEKRAYREGLSFVLTYPEVVLSRIPKKLVRFFYADVDGLLYNTGDSLAKSPADVLRVAKRLPIGLPSWAALFLYFLSQSFHLLLIVTAVLGVIRTYQTAPKYVLSILVILAFWAFLHVVVFFPQARFRLPVMPLVVVLSAGYGATLGDHPLREAAQPSREGENKPVRQ